MAVFSTDCQGGGGVQPYVKCTHEGITGEVCEGSEFHPHLQKHLIIDVLIMQNGVTYRLLTLFDMAIA